MSVSREPTPSGRSNWLWPVSIALIAAGGLAWGLIASTFSDSFTMPVPGVIALLGIIGAFVLVFLALWLRSFKQRLLLQQIRPVQTARVFEGQMIGGLFNTILPFRIGEFMRAHYIGRAIRISRSAVFATILYERALDGMALALACVVLYLVGGGSQVLFWACVWMLVISFTLTLALVLARRQSKLVLRPVYHVSALFNDRIRDKSRMMVWSVIYASKHIMTRRATRTFVLLTAVMWLCYFAAFALLAIALVNGVAALSMLRASLAGILGVTIPSGPAYLNVFGPVFGGVSGLSADALNSGITVYAWLLNVLPPVVLGIVFLLAWRAISARKFTQQGDAGKQNALENKLFRDADITPEFSHFLDAYFRGDEITRTLSTQEFLGNLTVLKTFKGGSNAVTLLAIDEGRPVVKKVTTPQYRDKLIDQYQWLDERSQFSEIAHVTRGIESNEEFVALSIEYQENYQTFFQYIHSHSVQDSAAILNRIWQFMNAEIYRDQQPVADAIATLNEYVETKVLQKAIDASKSSFELVALLSYDTLVVNGRTVLNLGPVMERITSHPAAMSDLSSFSACAIHGDLTVDNIMIDPDTQNFLLLDPNNENAISAPVVDAGKLLQSLHSGYEFLVDMSTVTVEENVLLFAENKSAQYARLDAALRKILVESLGQNQAKTTLFHEAVHYFRMLTYRVNINPETAPAFYAIGVRLLNDFIEQYDDATGLHSA